jgi:hypothetical protein
MPDLIEGAGDKLDNLLEKVSGPSGRFGHTGERAYAMGKEDVADSVIAAQLTATSKALGNGHVYDERFAAQLQNLYEDCVSGTPIPKKVAKSLIKDQRKVKSLTTHRLLNA